MDPSTSSADAAAEPTVVHVPERRRFDLVLAGQRVGLADYLDVVGPPRTWRVTHTEVDPALQGRGLASQLVTGLFDAAAAEGVRIDPVCPYVRMWVSRHPERAGIVG